jgi:hypothetical protein
MSPFQKFTSVWEEDNMLNYRDSNLLLSETIDSLQDELRKYAVLPDAKLGYIEKQNTLILNLTTAYNGMQITQAKLWQALENCMDEMRQIDPHLKGFTIYITEKPAGHMARIDINTDGL